MLPDWENKFRKHWPHHYRDVLDKINSPLGMVVVNDTEKSYKDCERPIIRFEKSFKTPTNYKVLVQDPLTSKVLEEKSFEENDLESSMKFFVNLLGGWEERSSS